MGTYPKEASARVARREKIRQDALSDAETAARRIGRSLNCAGSAVVGIKVPRHAPYGCRNDGSGCICECHDPGEGP